MEVRGSASATSPVVNNYKVHILLTPGGVEKIRKNLALRETTSHGNFVVVRDVYTYSIFVKKGYVNITGIRNNAQLKRVIPEICISFCLEEHEIASDVIIDNISASGKFGGRINTTHVQEQINKRGKERHRFFTASTNRGLFPGTFCRTQGHGTITVFTTGAYVTVGSKCLDSVERLFQEMSVVSAQL